MKWLLMLLFDAFADAAMVLLVMLLMLLLLLLLLLLKCMAGWWKMRQTKTESQITSAKDIGPLDWRLAWQPAPQLLWPMHGYIGSY